MSVRITVNGRTYDVPASKIGYRDVLTLAGFVDDGALYTVTYHDVVDAKTGTLQHDEEVEPEVGFEFFAQKRGDA